MEKKEAQEAAKKEQLTKLSQETSIYIQNTPEEWEVQVTERPRSSQRFLTNQEWVEDEIHPEDEYDSEFDNDDIELQ